MPFDADDPFNTPRDLAQDNPQVQQAMADAIEYLRSKSVPFDAPVGPLQVAGDRGAPAIPLGGGLGDLAGNANALASSDPIQNRTASSPITYGSSHIQAIAFLDDGRVLARTILTYSQYENPQLALLQRPDPAVLAGAAGCGSPGPSGEIRRQLLRVVRLTG